MIDNNFRFYQFHAKVGLLEPNLCMNRYKMGKFLLCVLTVYSAVLAGIKWNYLSVTDGLIRCWSQQSLRPVVASRILSNSSMILNFFAANCHDEMMILHAPSALKFREAEELNRSNLKNVLATALGYSVETVTSRYNYHLLPYRVKHLNLRIE